MEDLIRGAFPAAEVELAQSWGGVFEVSRDGQPIWSKKQVGRFPDWEEIRSRLASPSAGPAPA